MVVADDDEDEQSIAPHGRCGLALSALGGALHVLQRALIDVQLLSMRCVLPYVPFDLAAADEGETCDGNGKEAEGAAADAMDIDEGKGKGGKAGSSNAIGAAAAAAGISLDLDTSSSGVAATAARGAVVSAPSASVGAGEWFSQRCMVLDANTLRNLEILPAPTGDDGNSLFSFLNHCRTSMGARTLRRWLCAPLCEIAAIESRLNAVEALKGTVGGSDALRDVADAMRRRNNSAKAFEAMLRLVTTKPRGGQHHVYSADDTPALAAMPDLPRLLARVHAYASKHRFGQGQQRASSSSSGAGLDAHPESRAVFYETQKYNIRQVKDLANAATGIAAACRLSQCISQALPEGERWVSKERNKSK